MTELEKSEGDRAERLILDLLDSRSGAQILGDESESEFQRETVEVLGLLPWALAEVAPRAEVKRRLLEAVEAVEREAAMPVGQAAGGRARAPVHPGYQQPEPGRSRRAARPVTSWPTWLVPLAASVAVAMMAVTGWLVIQVQNQRAQIAELSSELENARSVTAALATSQGMLAEVRSRLALVTAPGAEFCALSPPEGSSATGARGVVVMHPVKDEWFLRIEGLEPCPQGRNYIVWFATEGGQVPGPIFAVKADEAVELTVSGHPKKINAIMITLEGDPVPQVPSMAPLLFGDERMQLL